MTVDTPSPSPTPTHVHADPSAATPKPEGGIRAERREEEADRMPDPQSTAAAALDETTDISLDAQEVTEEELGPNPSTSRFVENVSGPKADQEGAATASPLKQTVTSTTDKPYSAFAQPTKWMIVGLGGICACFSPISSNIFVPAIPTLSTAFGKSEEDITLAVTIYLVFQAVTPSFFGSMSDSFGRRPVYISTLTVYLAANIGLACMPTSAYWLLLFLRALQASGGSAVVAIGAGCVADVAEPRERGKYMAIFQCGWFSAYDVVSGRSDDRTCPGTFPGRQVPWSLLDVVLIFVGVFTATLGWRSIFWFLAISTGVVLIPVTFFMPETLRSLVGDGSIPPPLLNASPQTCIQHRKMKKQHEDAGQAGEHIERPPHKKYAPFSAFLVLLTPEILLVYIFVSFLYLEFYCILALYSSVLKDVYALKELDIGLAYLPSGLGTIISSIANGRQLDYYYQREERRVGGDYRKKKDEFRIELTRLKCIIPFLGVFIVATTALGWCLESKAPLAATLVVNFFVGLGSGTIGTATVYGQDLKPGQGGAVSASLNLVRCIFGAVGTAVIQILYTHLGAGWTTVLLSGLCLLSSPLALIVIKYASGWRLARAEKSERRKVADAGRGTEGSEGKGVVSGVGGREGGEKGVKQI